jgi:hypothetical protein
MIISYKWLKEFIDTDKTAVEIADLLTKQVLSWEGSYLGENFLGLCLLKFRD